MTAVFIIVLLIGLLVYRHLTEPKIWIDTIFIAIFVLFLLGMVILPTIEPLQVSMEVQNIGNISQTQKSVIKNIQADGKIELTARTVSFVK